MYKTRAVLVDASLCINPFDSRWVRDELGILEVVGNVEAVDVMRAFPPFLCRITLFLIGPQMDFDPPLIPAHIKVEVCEVSVLVRALLVVPRPDLDLDVWDSSVRVVSVP